jgi:hypothetical protein
MKAKPSDKPRKPKAPPADEKPEPKLKPVGPRIGEGRDNLSRRAEWFQRRAGQDQ